MSIVTVWFASETPWLWTGVSGYAATALAAWHGALRGIRTDRIVMGLMLLGVVAFAGAIAARWVRVGYGPFLTMFEILLSNLFSLGLVFLVAYWRVALARSSALVSLPILTVLGIWLVSVSGEPSRLPATYDNPWLWVHVGVGKLFLGTALVAVGLAGLLLMRQAGLRLAALHWVPATADLDALAWRFMALAFVFDSLMLIAGAVWAQDAWGRYWAWDPLETWAFVTWLALGVSLHARLTYNVPAWLGWVAILGVFALAFLTFFGVPFISLAPHKGIL